MKQWHRIDQNTKREEIISAGRVLAGLEVRLNLTKQGARDLMAAAVGGDGIIVTSIAIYEYREPTESERT